MSKTDFFDDDLIRPRSAADLPKGGMQGQPTSGEVTPHTTSDIPPRPVGEFNLTRMARHKEEVNEQVAHASQELERLKQVEENIKREKRDLEELRQKQEEFERGKSDMAERISQSLGRLEKQALDAERLAGLASDTRIRFKELGASLEALHEETWAKDKYREELNRALAVIDDTRMEYNKSITKVEALSTADSGDAGKTQAPVIFEERSSAPASANYAFSDWIKIGLAVSLPLIIALIVLSIIFMALQNRGLI